MIILVVIVLLSRSCSFNFSKGSCTSDVLCFYLLSLSGTTGRGLWFTRLATNGKPPFSNIVCVGKFYDSCKKKFTLSLNELILLLITAVLGCHFQKYTILDQWNKRYSISAMEIISLDSSSFSEEIYFIFLEGSVYIS